MCKDTEIIVLEPNKQGVYEDTGKIEEVSHIKQSDLPAPVEEFLSGFSKGADFINAIRGIINGKH